MSEEKTEKQKANRMKIVSVLTILLIILFLGIYIGFIYSMIELIPIPLGFSNKWEWYFTNPFANPNACPWGIKILIFGSLMCCLFIGLTISIYIWKKGKGKLYNLIFGTTSKDKKSDDTSIQSENKNDKKIEWTNVEKAIANVLSWGITISLVIIIAGGLWSLIDILLLYLGNSTYSFFDFFLTLTTGVQLVIIFGAIAGLFAAFILFYIFLIKGHRFFLNLLFKIEE